jgi:proteic killer suppression protein
LINSFADKETEKIWEGEKSKVLPIEIQQVARRKLRMINNADTINDLRIPPANRLKKLKGELSNIYTIESPPKTLVPLIFSVFAPKP